MHRAITGFASMLRAGPSPLDPTQLGGRFHRQRFTPYGDVRRDSETMAELDQGLPRGDGRRAGQVWRQDEIDRIGARLPDPKIVDAAIDSTA